MSVQKRNAATSLVTLGDKLRFGTAVKKPEESQYFEPVLWIRTSKTGSYTSERILSKPIWFILFSFYFLHKFCETYCTVFLGKVSKKFV
jgi:hypothetical protein